MQQSDFDLTMFFYVLGARQKGADQAASATDDGTPAMAPSEGAFERIRTLIGGPRRAAGRRVGQVGVPSSR